MKTKQIFSSFLLISLFSSAAIAKSNCFLLTSPLAPKASLSDLQLPNGLTVFCIQDISPIEKTIIFGRTKDKRIVVGDLYQAYQSTAESFTYSLENRDPQLNSTTIKTISFYKNPIFSNAGALKITTVFPARWKKSREGIKEQEFVYRYQQLPDSEDYDAISWLKRDSAFIQIEPSSLETLEWRDFILSEKTSLENPIIERNTWFDIVFRSIDSKTIFNANTHFKIFENITLPKGFDPAFNKPSSEDRIRMVDRNSYKATLYWDQVLYMKKHEPKLFQSLFSRPDIKISWNYKFELTPSAPLNGN